MNAGRLKAGFADYPIVAYNLQQGRFPDVRLVSGYKPMVVGSVGIGVRKSDQELLKKINASLAKIKADGTLEQDPGEMGLAGLRLRSQPGFLLRRAGRGGGPPKAVEGARSSMAPAVAPSTMLRMVPSRASRVRRRVRWTAFSSNPPSSCRSCCRACGSPSS